MDTRYCSNCRAALPPKAEECPACGVYAGDLYDERMHRPKPRLALFGTLLVLAIAGGGVAAWWNARSSLPDRAPVAPSETPRTRVVGDRPGGARRAPGAEVNQAEAVRLVKRHLVVTRGLKNECIVLLGQGTQRGAYLFTARDHCTSTRLGKWRVDAKSGEVEPAR